MSALTTTSIRQAKFESRKAAKGTFLLPWLFFAADNSPRALSVFCFLSAASQSPPHAHTHTKSPSSQPIESLITGPCERKWSWSGNTFRPLKPKSPGKNRRQPECLPAMNRRKNRGKSLIDEHQEKWYSISWQSFHRGLDSMFLFFVAKQDGIRSYCSQKKTIFLAVLHYWGPAVAILHCGIYTFKSRFCTFKNTSTLEECLESIQDLERLLEEYGSITRPSRDKRRLQTGA